jgi:hypothetical protein
MFPENEGRGLGKKKLMGGAHQSVRERGNRVDWDGAGLADPGSAQCCLFSFFCFETFPILCFSILCCLQKQPCLKREISNFENF